VLLFLQLYAAHLVADFLLQPDWIARDKRKLSTLSAHAGIHFGVACAFVNLGLNRSVLAAIAVLVLVHVLSDYLKAALSSDSWLAFSVDQAVHLIAVGVTSLWLATSSWSQLFPILATVAKNKDLYLIAAAYVAVVFGGGFFVQKVTKSFLDQLGDDTKQLKPGLPSAGKYIGWVERFLILTFVIGGYGDAIGFLLAAKALARYPEIKEDEKGHFAEYFLVGTLTSVGLALVAGLIVIRVRAFF